MCCLLAVLWFLSVFDLQASKDLHSCNELKNPVFSWVSKFYFASVHEQSFDKHLPPYQYFLVLVTYWKLSADLHFRKCTRASRWHGVKNLPANAEDTRDASLIPGSGRSPGDPATHSSYSCLENSKDRGAWWAILHGLQRVRHNWAYTDTSDVGTSYHLNENLESKPMLLHFNKALMVIPMHGQIWELYPIWAHEPDHIYDLKTLEGEMFVVLTLASWLWNTHTVNDIPWVWKNAYTSRSAHALRII